MLRCAFKINTVFIVLQCEYDIVPLHSFPYVFTIVISLLITVDTIKGDLWKPGEMWSKTKLIGGIISYVFGTFLKICILE